MLMLFNGSPSIAAPWSASEQKCLSVVQNRRSNMKTQLPTLSVATINTQKQWLESCMFSVFQQLLVSYKMNVWLPDQYILLCKRFGAFIFLRITQWNKLPFLIIPSRNRELVVQLRYVPGPGRFALVLSLLRPPRIELSTRKYRRRVSRKTESDTPVESATQQCGNAGYDGVALRVRISGIWDLADFPVSVKPECLKFIPNLQVLIEHDVLINTVQGCEGVVGSSVDAAVQQWDFMLETVTQEFARIRWKDHDYILTICARSSRFLDK